MLLDTNVLLHNLQYVSNLVTMDTPIEIPFIVLEELSRLQHDEHSQGYLARQANRFIENNGDKISIINTVKTDIDKYFITPSNDDLILNTARQNNLILVTDDVNMRIKARALNIQVIASKKYFDINSILNPCEVFDLTPKQKSELYSNKVVNLDTLQYKYGIVDNLPAVQEGNELRLLETYKMKRSSDLYIKPKNIEQKFMLSALLDEKVKLLTALGVAGSGKTLLSIVAGLQLVMQLKFKKILFIVKPFHVSNKDRIGYLPGELSSKLYPYVQAIEDNLHVIYNDSIPDNLRDLFNSDIIDIVALDFLRGRTFHDSFVIVDEQQNYDLHEIKTILTRLSDSSKAIVLGDIEQNDNSLAPDSTGLFTLVSAFTNISYARHVSLKDSVRGQLSKDSAKLLV